jgi:hypothetical protein
MSAEFDSLSLEDQAARLLFFREHRFTSVRRLAALMELPVERVELLMCRGLSTLVACGYPPEELCEVFSLTPEQLARSATTPAFSEAFKPLGAWRCPCSGLPDDPESGQDQLPADQAAAG